MTIDPLDRRSRAGTLGTVIALHLAALLVLIQARGPIALVPDRAPPLQMIDILEPPPPPPPAEIRTPPEPRKPTPRAEPKREGAAAPAAKTSLATQIAALDPVVPLPLPTPVVTAATPATGAAPSQGAAPVAGPGSGAGGEGTGTGSGATGNGTGAGGRGTPPHLVAGAITRRDYPRELRDSDVPIEVITLQYSIDTDGFVRNCLILKSSGSALLDQRTCQLYETRFRYEPARDAAGQPQRVTAHATRSWFIVR